MKDHLAHTHAPNLAAPHRPRQVGGMRGRLTTMGAPNLTELARA